MLIADVSFVITRIKKIVSSLRAHHTDAKIYGARKDNDKVYFHATTSDAAAMIISSMTLKGSQMEGGFVFAWEYKPSKKALRLSGTASAEIIVAFSSNSPFETDWGIELKTVRMYRPVCTVLPVPVHINQAMLLEA